MQINIYSIIAVLKDKDKDKLQKFKYYSASTQYNLIAILHASVRYAEKFVTGILFLCESHILLPSENNHSMRKANVS